MSTVAGTPSEQGIEFFGRMTASISHEIKNTLAIVNENAGLLGDLALLMDKGRPLSPERLTTLAGNIRRQVQRADDIIRRLNRFAHSAHEPAASVDLGLQLLAEEELALPLVHVLLHGGLQLVAHLHRLQPLGQLFRHPVKQVVQGHDLEDLLLDLDLQVELRTDQVGDVERVGQAVDRGHQFRRQLGGADQFGSRRAPVTAALPVQARLGVAPAGERTAAAPAGQRIG